MKKETKRSLNKAIREAYEPSQKRKLTQKEVDEIREFLMEYFGLLSEIHQRLEREKASKGK